MKLVVALLFTMFSRPAQAEVKVELYADCANYCSFQEFEDNCHGIAFKRVSNDGTKFLYTHATDEGCTYDRLPYYHFISREEVNKACTCEGIQKAPALPDKESAMSEDTAKKLVELQNTIKKWAICAPDPLTIQPKDELHPFKAEDTESCQAMKEKGKQGYLYLGGCSVEHPEYCTYYGNTNNYSGPLCFAGDMDRCEEVRKSQDPETGAWYRNAFQRRFPESERGQPLFSRDEFIGVMLYLLKTNDKTAAEKWMRFIDNNAEKRSSILGALDRVVDICPQHRAERPSHIPESEWTEMQTDDRCEMRPDSWGTMYRVYEKLGFSDRELKKISKKLYWKMRLNTPINAITANLSARTVKDVGYEQGNQATNILILRALGMDRNGILKDASDVIDRRSGYESPYYHWLAQDGKATEYGAALIRKYCPLTMPQYGNTPNGLGVPSASFFDFGVHYFGGVEAGWQKVLPTGHECIGWINLYLGN